MHIIHIASECAPFVKIGGLADVTYGLSRALANQEGISVEIILPYYKTIDTSSLASLTKDPLSTTDCTYWKSSFDNITLTLVEPLTNNFFQRDEIYGFEDDAQRFIYFCQKAFNYVKSQQKDAILHLHDWHTALVALLNQRADKPYPTLYTIHNLAYQGPCSQATLQSAGFTPQELSLLKEQDHYLLMKAGIEYCDRITTVSKTYAQEIITSEKGGNLQPLLFAHQDKIDGIVNGIDTEYWNRQTDPYLPKGFDKHAMQKKLGLEVSDVPLVCSVTRLVEQKGPLLILEAIKETLRLGGQYVLLAAVADPQITQRFLELKDEPNLFMQLTYSEELSHLAFAASDLLVMPSLFEPCGLTQLIAMRYGCLPLVHATGGLKETVAAGKNGFSFETPTKEALRACLHQAFAAYRDPQKWQGMLAEAVSEDHSWKKSVKKYLTLYKKNRNLNR